MMVVVVDSLKSTQSGWLPKPSSTFVQNPLPKKTQTNQTTNKQTKKQTYTYEVRLANERKRKKQIKTKSVNRFS